MTTNPIAAVIFDWAGTTIDWGCVAPVLALQETFADQGISISEAEARLHMGLAKKEHLKSILNLVTVANQWILKHERSVTDNDVNILYSFLERKLLETVSSHSHLIEGTLPLVELLRKDGIPIGSTTGYTAEMMRIVQERAASQGYSPDVIVTPDQVKVGRTAPLMIYLNAVKLSAYPLSRIIKIGDTIADIAEGKNAGCWTIGLALSGNALGLTQSEIQKLTPIERTDLFAKAREQLFKAGADYVVDSIADCAPIIESIALRIKDNHRPSLYKG
jgi:phosphonoacetaldehyde hydrolase